jgi:hypothetical protein
MCHQYTGSRCVGAFIWKQRPLSIALGFRMCGNTHPLWGHHPPRPPAILGLHFRIPGRNLWGAVSAPPRPPLAYLPALSPPGANSPTGV